MADKKYDFSDFDQPAQPAAKSEYDFSDFSNDPQDQNAQTNDTGILATLLGQGLKGATMGTMDRIEGAIAVPLRAMGFKNTGGNIQDIESAAPTLDLEELGKAYTETRDAARGKSERQKEARPGLSLASNVVGGLLTPGLAVANVAGKGIGAAIGAGAAVGAGSGAIATAADTKEIEDINASDVLINSLIGGTIGAAIPAAGGLLKGAGNMVKNSSIGQKVGKIYNKSKDGIDLVSKEAQESFNKQLLGTSDEIVDEVVGSAKKFKDEYSQIINTMKIADPKRFQGEIDELVETLAKKQSDATGFDVRTVDATINKLQKEERVSKDQIRALRGKIVEAVKAKKEMNSQAKYVKAGQSVDAKDIAKGNLSQKVDIEANVRQAQDELKEARRAYQDASKFEKQDLKLEIRQKEDALTAIRREAKDAGFDVTDEALARTKDAKIADTVGSSQQDILTQTGGLEGNLNVAMEGNIELNRKIADLIKNKGELNNTAFSGLLDQVNILKNNAANTSLGGIKDANINSIRSYAEQMGRKDLVKQIDDIISKNVPGAQKLDADYRNMMTGLKELGVSTNEMSGDVIKNSDAGTYLAQQLKNTAKNETGDAANKLASSQDILKNAKVNELVTKGKTIGENYNLSKNIADSSFTSPLLRGAAGAGKITNTVANTAPIKAMTKAASRLGNSSLGMKVAETMNLPEGEIRNRAIFTLMQQPWFRAASKENEK